MPDASYARVLADTGMISDISPEPLPQSDATEDVDERGSRQPRRDTDVLVERLTAVLVRHQPGWRLPRPSELARRYHASHEEIGTAIDELVRRRLIRRMPNGHLIRPSAAEYLVPLEGIAGIRTRIDPMGADIALRRYRVMRRNAPAEIAATLRVPHHEPLATLQLDWSLDGEPAAIVRTYLAPHLDAFLGASAERGSIDARYLPAAPDIGDPAFDAASCRPRAATIEMQAAPPWAARSLHMAGGQPALLVSVRFDDTAQNRPAAITSAVLRPDMFRVALAATADQE